MPKSHIICFEFSHQIYFLLYFFFFIYQNWVGQAFETLPRGRILRVYPVHVMYRQIPNKDYTLVRNKICLSLRGSWSIACRSCSNYIFILDLTPGFNGLGNDKWKKRRGTLQFLDLVCPIPADALVTLWAKQGAMYSASMVLTELISNILVPELG